MTRYHVDRYLKWWLSSLFLSLLINLPIKAANNEAVFTEQTLSFGIIAVGGKKELSTITVSNNGETHSTNQIHILQPGHPAIFNLVNYPANIKLTIIASILKPQMDNKNISDSAMKLIKIITPEFVTTDGTGFASVVVGGTLQTSGPVSNSDAQGNDYNAQIVLDIHY